MTSQTTRFLCYLVTLVPLLLCTRAEAAGGKYQRTVADYSMPDVLLVNQDGQKVHFKSFIEQSDQPVMLDFIYGTCTTICPILSAGFASLQRKLGPEASKVRLVSITIDPEHDNPRVMKDYLKRFRAKPGWDFMTGSRADIDRVMRAFDAYIPNKMSHYQIMLIRSPRDGRWTRVMELVSSADIMAEYRQAGAK